MKFKDIIFGKKKEVIEEEEVKEPDYPTPSRQIELNEGIKFKR